MLEATSNRNCEVYENQKMDRYVASKDYAIDVSNKAILMQIGLKVSLDSPW